MRKKTVTLVFSAIISILFISMSAVYIYQQTKGNNRRIAEIYQNGKLIETVDLGAEEGFELRLEDGEGGYNLIKVTNGCIGIAEANCRNQTCVRTGFIDGGYMPVICLPHKIEIRPTEQGDADAFSR